MGAMQAWHAQQPSAQPASGANRLGETVNDLHVWYTRMLISLQGAEMPVQLHSASANES